MSEWMEQSLGEIAEIIMGQSPSGEMCNTKGNGIPLLNGPTEFTKKYPMAVQHTVDARKLAKKGDILFCVRGSTTGKMNWADKEYAIGRGLAAISHKTDKKAQYFVRAIMEFNLPSILGGATGSTFPNVSGEELRNLKVLVPQLTEQRTIAEVLSSLDEKIDLLHRQNKTLEQLAETLFRQWFVEEADESWAEKSLDEIAEYLNGLALQKFPGDKLPVIKIREMKLGISENTDRCSDELPDKYIIHDGDILFSWSGSLEVVIWSGGEGALNQHLFKIDSKMYPKWFYYLATKHHLENFKAIAESKSTTMGHIQREHLSDAKMRIPPKDSFQKHDKSIAPLIEKIIRNNSQIRILTQKRDILLPKLLSGEILINE